jgi:FKBP-type peptidyl-prolyl cis-trans isomerase
MVRSFLKFGLFIAISALIGCGNADYKRNSDGLIYRIIRSGEGELVKPKTFLKVHQSAGMADTLFFSSFGKVPSFGYFDSLQAPTHDFLDILSEMRVGDSAIVIRSVDSLVKKGIVQYDKRLKKGSTIKVFVKVLKVYDSQEEMEADKVKELELYKNGEIAALENYLSKETNVKFEKLPEGVFVSIEKKGAGMPIDSGMDVSVKYTGSLIDGTVFDSNVDSTFGHTEPFKFKVGSGQVIAGWDLGIKRMNKGSKGKIYIPSMLGYGFQGSGAKIPPYSNLVFEIEVLDTTFNSNPVPDEINISQQ